MKKYIDYSCYGTSELIARIYELEATIQKMKDKDIFYYKCNLCGKYFLESRNMQECNECLNSLPL